MQPKSYYRVNDQILHLECRKRPSRSSGHLDSYKTLRVDVLASTYRVHGFRDIRIGKEKAGFQTVTFGGVSMFCVAKHELPLCKILVL